jgi:CBS-domain-containing membrane protein
MMLPPAVYFVASGKLIRLKVPGVDLNFAKKAGETVKPGVGLIAYSDLQIVARDGARKLLAQVRGLNQAQPVVMTMTIGGSVHYTVQDVKRYLDVLSQLRSFKLVVFLDSEKRVVAYMEAWALKELVEQTETEFADEFVKFINSGQKDDIADSPNVAKETISKNSTNIEALSEMQAQNLEALVVVDEKTMLCGVVERDQVLTSIMLSLAGPSS